MAHKKDTYYFSHDCNARRDPKIIALRSVYGSEGYGWWWILLEILREQEEYRIDISKKFAFSSLATEMGITRDRCQEFVEACYNEFELLQTDGRFIWSESMCRRMERYDEKLKKLSERGKKGAAVTNEKKAKKSAQATEEVGTSDQEDRLSHGTSGEKVAKLDKIRLEENNRVSNDTLGAGKPAPHVDERQNELKRIYDALEKNKRSVVEFIRDNKPAFLMPYVDAWNMFAVEYKLAKVVQINDSRKRKFRKRIREPQFDFLQVLAKAKASNFLMQGLFFTFDWILENDSNYLKVIEGNYDNNRKTEKTTTNDNPEPTAEEIQRQIDERYQARLRKYGVPGQGTATGS